MSEKVYIECNAALTEFNKTCTLCRELVLRPMCGECSIADTIRHIKELPPADVRPMARGEWIGEVASNLYITRICSVCGERTAEDLFCSRCGAAMNEEAVKILARRYGEEGGKTMSDEKEKYYELLSERFHWCIDCGYIGGEHEGAYCEDCKEYWRKLREAREEAKEHPERSEE